MKNILFFFVLASALLFYGCAGKNFEKINERSLVLNKTTMNDIKKVLGKPFVEKSVIQNSNKITYIVYYYQNEMAKGDGPNTMPKRNQTFYFSKDKLIGHFYSSSVKDDSTDFDIRKAKTIEKGVATEEDILAIFGPSNGEFVYPLTENQDDRIILYKYERPVIKGAMIYSFTKSLRFLLDSKGVVKNIQAHEVKPDI